MPESFNLKSFSHKIHRFDRQRRRDISIYLDRKKYLSFCIYRVLGPVREVPQEDHLLVALLREHACPHHLLPVHEVAQRLSQGLMDSGRQGIIFGHAGDKFRPTRWSTTFSSKGTLPHANDFRALCDANLAMQPSKFGRKETFWIRIMD